MSDAPKIFNTTEKYVAMDSEARCILILMGFDGVRDFSKRSGINHDTAGQILGTVKLKQRKNYPLIVRTNETLHTAYMEQRATMPRTKRAYVVDWVKRWQKRVVEEVLRLDSPGKCKGPGGTARCAQQTGKRQAAIKAGVVLALDVLKWEV